MVNTCKQIYRISNSEILAEKGFARFREILIFNDYPDWFINKFTKIQRGKLDENTKSSVIKEPVKLPTDPSTEYDKKIYFLQCLDGSKTKEELVNIINEY